MGILGLYSVCYGIGYVFCLGAIFTYLHIYIEQVSTVFEMLNTTQLKHIFTPQIDRVKHAQIETHFSPHIDLLDFTQFLSRRCIML